MEEIKQRFERGYTMAIYGTREALYQQMRSDIDALLQALSLHNVSVSFLYNFVNEFTDIEIPKEAIKESLDKLNER